MTNPVQWRVLPNKANQAMEQAGADAAREYLERTGSNSLFAIYEAMVLAAPTPPHVEGDEICAALPKPVDDSALPMVGEAVYDAWDMAQQWNGCREAFLPVVMRLKAECDSYRDALRQIGDGVAERNALLAIAYGDIEHASKSLGQCVSCGECPEDDDIITHDPSCTFCAIEMVLASNRKVSASAEPSAPVEHDEEKAFEVWRKEQIASLLRMGCQAAATAFRDLGSVQWAGWQARAALEKNP
ncbi:hypothetical protein [Pseudomonas taiwanensis]|uniref:hypothetical protein n=1 Tax=Pseudomonas taiwanensis TaxID=470150 RepID=UPI00164594D3|nr:hypothetical protein [Pseudomonas taiwanensis]MBC3489876.1 hypothetical protein [Pseudomonas taiwanensis]